MQAQISQESLNSFRAVNTPSVCGDIQTLFVGQATKNSFLEKEISQLEKSVIGYIQGVAASHLTLSIGELRDIFLVAKSGRVMTDHLIETINHLRLILKKAEDQRDARSLLLKQALLCIERAREQKTHVPINIFLEENSREISEFMEGLK